MKEFGFITLFLTLTLTMSLNVVYDPGNLPQDKLQESWFILTKLVKGAHSYLNNSITLLPQYTGPITFPMGGKCDYLKLPSYVYNPVQADYVVFLTTTYDNNSDWRVYGRPCNSDIRTLRPTHGYLKFNLANINFYWDYNDDWDAMVLETIRELNHIFVFHTSTYFGFPEGFKLYSASYKLNYSMLINEIQTHYNCFTNPTLYGAPMEIYNLDKRDFGSYWLKRFSLDDVMTAGRPQYFTKLSRLGLIMYELSGWFNVKYDYTEQRLWSWNVGCNWLNYQCRGSTVGFCGTPQSLDCTFDFKRIGSCQGNYTTLPNTFGYNSPDYAGMVMDPIMDTNCPYYQHNSDLLDCQAPLGVQGD
jgi:hypothetical protein